jgi:uncharacterized C2H2 Zn-finger protein
MMLDCPHCGIFYRAPTDELLQRHINSVHTPEELQQRKLAREAYQKSKAERKPSPPRTPYEYERAEFDRPWETKSWGEIGRLYLGMAVIGLGIIWVGGWILSLLR